MRLPYFIIFTKTKVKGGKERTVSLWMDRALSGSGSPIQWDSTESVMRAQWKEKYSVLEN